MNLISTLKEFSHSLLGQGFRTLSTLLGIAWGTIAVVLLVAFGQGLETDLQERAKALGQGLVIAWPQKTTLSYEGMAKGRVLRLRADDVMRLPSQIPELHSVCAEYQDHELLRQGTSLHSIRLSGVYPPFQDLRMMIPQPGGRFINRRDIQDRRRVVFMGDQIKKDIFGESTAVGRLVTIRGLPFTVVGVMKSKPQESDYGGPDSNRVYLPATTHATLFNRDFISNFVFRAANLSEHDRAVNRVFEVLGRHYWFDPKDRAAISLWDTTEDARMFRYFFVGFNTVLGGSGGLTLLIGGIGVANLMYILVRQRTREIAIQMALGARPRGILLEVLGQAVGLVFVGGALGVLISVTTIWLISGTHLTEQIGDPVLSPLLAVTTVLLLVTVGLIAGYFPARRAARLEPARVLAEE